MLRWVAQQQAPISRQRGERRELSRPGQAPRPARGVDPTAKLEYDDIRARAISRADNDDDVQGINASIELIRRTRGGSWPTEPVSVDFGYVDEVWQNASSVRAARSPTPCTTPAASTPDAATCTRWDGHPFDRRTAHVRRRCELVGHARRRTGAATRTGPPGPRARSGRASSLRPRIDIAATVYPTSGRRRDGGVESWAGLSASTSSSMKSLADLAVGDDVEHGLPVLAVPTTYADSEVNPLAR